jgi:hypothetical protein
MVSDVCQAELKKLAYHTWSSLGAWVVIIFVVLVSLITATVIVGKDYSYGCENSETPTCKNGEYKRRMWSNKSFIWFLLLSVGFLIMTGSFFYFSGKQITGAEAP